MPLHRANVSAIIRYLKPLFVIAGDDGLQIFTRQRFAFFLGTDHQRVEISPALGIQDQADGFGSVAQNKADKLAQGSQFCIHGRTR